MHSLQQQLFVHSNSGSLKCHAARTCSADPTTIKANTARMSARTKTKKVIMDVISSDELTRQDTSDTAPTQLRAFLSVPYR